MELQGKRIAFLGDSITGGAGVSSMDNVFWNVVAKRTGAICTGNGVGGARIARQINPNPEAPYDFQHFHVRVEELDPDAEIVVVFGGTNDFAIGDAPFGCMNDREDGTFYGGLHVLCEKLINRYPAAQLVFMTPLHRWSEDNVGFNEMGLRAEHPLRDYVEAIREVAEFYSIPVLDLFRVSGMQPRIEAQRELFMPDGLHPNDVGAARLADKVISFLHTLG